MGGHAGAPLYGHILIRLAATSAPRIWDLVLHTLVVRMQLADASCTPGGLRAVAEMALAEERTRQNGAPNQRLGDRQMEGLLIAVLSLMVMASERCRGSGRPLLRHPFDQVSP